MAVLSHITLGTNDVDRAARFYDATLGVLGFARLPKPVGIALAYERAGALPTICICQPADGRPATWANGSHLAFTAASRIQVEAFHEQALATGGSNEGEPGWRRHYAPNYYAAYVRDPDGNKLEVVCHLEL